MARGASAAADPERSDTSAEPTLGDVVDELGPAVLTVISAPLGLGVPVAHPVIYDAARPPAIEAGDIVLAVGVDPDEQHAVKLVASSGAASAVVFRISRDVDPRLVSEASTAGVALLGAPEEMSWEQLFGLLRTWVPSGGEPAGGSMRFGDLFSLANAVAAMVGGAVTIDSAGGRVLAYSTLDQPIDELRRRVILSMRSPDEWERRLHASGVYRKLRSSPDVVRYEDPSGELRTRLAISVRAGDEILGSIWVSQGDAPLGPQAEGALREAARIAALHLIRYRSTQDIERGVRAEQLRSLLDGRGSARALGERLGIDLRGQSAVLAFEVSGVDEADVAVRRERVQDLVSLYCEAYRREAACACIGSTVYALLPVVPPTTPARLVTLAQDIVGRAESSMGVALRAAIGPVVGAVEEIPSSRAEADRVLRAMSHTAEERGTASIDDIRATAILLELSEYAADKPYMLDGKIARLQAYDEEHGTSYVESLRAYLDAFGSIPRAAKSLDTHPNTFRYRLERALKLSGLDLTDPQERIVAELQLRLR